MNLIGFSFTKLHAHRTAALAKRTVKANNLEVLNIEKEDVSLQMKNPAYRVTFSYQVKYTDKDSKKEEMIGEVLIEGFVLLALQDDEAKEFMKTWKKKEVPDFLKQPLFNLILKKCAPKAIEMEDTVNLPFHIPIPQINLKK